MVIVKPGVLEAEIARAVQLITAKKRLKLRHIECLWCMAFPPVFVRLAPEARTGDENLKRHAFF